MSKDTPAKASDPFDLEQQIMDANVAKNEREWWAYQEIGRLRSVESELRGRLKYAESTIAAYVHTTGFDHKAACPICNGVEGCPHTFSERYHAMIAHEESDT